MTRSMQPRTSKGINWAARLEAIQNEPKEAPEPGFFTVSQWSKKLNRQYARTNRICQLAHEDGAMEKKVYRIQLSHGAMRPVIHYRLVKAAR